MRALSVALVFAVLALPAAAAPRKASKEQTLREATAKVWVNYARWLKLQGQKEEALTVLARASTVSVLPEVERLLPEIEALEGRAPSPSGIERRREKAFKDAARLYDKLAALKPPPGEEHRFEMYRWQAVWLDPSKSRVGKVLAAIKKAAGNRKNADEACRMLVRLRDADPKGAAAGRYDALEIELAKKDVALIKSPDHELVGYVSLPKSWNRKSKLHVLVTVDGAGSNFLGSARRFAQARGSRNFIVLAPCTLANTNALGPEKYPWYSPEDLEKWSGNRIRFDLDGLNGLLTVLRKRYGAKEKIGITGFSGGGNLTYAMTALHPDRILFSAPACANFAGMGYRDAQPVEDGGPPIQILTGANDPHRDYTHGNKNSPGIEPQTDAAMDALKRLGFKNVRRTMLPGVKHSNCSKQVWDFCDEVLTQRR